jgi:nucleosome binding factor SPN SPT16 subunit
MMRSIFRVLAAGFYVLLCTNANGQNINADNIEIQLVQQPKIAFPPNARNYKVIVTSPYNLTKEDIIRQSKADHKKALDNYDKTVAESEKEYQRKLKDHAEDEKKAREKYDIEIAEFKKRTLLERLAMTDQGKDPKLVLPAKPEYYKPSPPI